MLRLPSSWQSQICLRCRWRLQARVRPLKRITSSHQSQCFSQSQLFRQEELIQSVPVIDDNPLFDGPRIRYEPFDNPIIRYEQTGEPSPEQKRALKQALGVNALGKPADVFVFEPEQEKKKIHEFQASVRQDVEGEHEIDEAEILKRISDGIGIVGIQDAWEHIEEIRHDWEKRRSRKSRFVTEEQYNELHDKLCKGFTKPQLQSYANRIVYHRNVDETNLNQDYISDSYTRSAWSRGETPVTETRAPAFTVVSGNSEPSSADQLSYALKEEIAETILNDVWQINPPSHEHRIGELEIRLKPIPFYLIMKHSKASEIRD